MPTKVKGYAIVFNQRDAVVKDQTGKPLVYERVLPSAVSENTLKGHIPALLNHNIDRGVLASSHDGNGSMILSKDDKGVKYEFNLPNTSLASEVKEGIQRKDITGSSFTYATVKAKWAKDSDGVLVRNITDISRITDVSPVYTPAYKSANVELEEIAE